MSILAGVGLQFEESMSGYLGVDQTDPRQGAEIGKDNQTPIRFEVQIFIADLSRFLKISEHEAELSGTITFEPLGGTFTIRDGRFNLFTLDRETGIRQMVYRFKFTGGDGQTYFLHGHKEILDDRGKFDVIEDMTRLFTTIYRGEDDQAPVYGAGELYFKLWDAPSLAASMKVLGAASIWQKVAAYTAFASFAYGALRDEYLKDVRLFYETQYENLVLSGVLQGEDGPRSFFLVSGVHDKGFPWGDGETFWDVMLAIEDTKGGFKRYCITDRVLEGLHLDVERGIYGYRGPIFALETGYSASFSEMRSGANHLTEYEANFEVDFQAEPYEPVTFPFEVSTKLARRLSGSLAKKLREILPSEHPLGVQITPHTAVVSQGKFLINKGGGNTGGETPTEELQIDGDHTFGEAERSTFLNIKEPTMLYGYICAVRPASRSVRVQIHTDTLRNEREHWVKDQLDKSIGSIVSRTASREMFMQGGKLKVRQLGRQGEETAEGKLFLKVGPPVIEINNDHFPTAVFQRRITTVRDPSGEQCLALEEDMELMRFEPINSDKTVTVASIKNEGNKFDALDEVLNQTGFAALVEERLTASGKNKADFSIVIKPNFMFAYNKRDRTTFTDPELVAHLVKRLRAAGFEKIAVVEAQSTYGEYFDKRSVEEMAEYLGFDGEAGYEVIDMTKDALDRQQFGPHLGNHPVSRSWRDADFRISFAKNKTHAYAYYTLTLKNIYGALPLANKFKEYHCNRDIYHTTIEYLTAFPVHYGLIDAYISADGPFGIFADTRPNQTYTIIGGGDLVAVDWVGASKMGIDPLISKYMRLAVETFGKPEINLIGDSSLYRPWLNVPVALTLFTHKGLDAEYHFGNLFYTAAAQMDEEHFQHKSKALYIRLLRKLTLPIRRMFFVRTGENPSLGNRIASWVLYRLGY
ncbi:MAG: DUF362 domain-containing protein [Deltaproteobacteria bacterium]|jgi:uncharacterized protein (DUF362 family)